MEKTLNALNMIFWILLAFGAFKLCDMFLF